MKNYRRACLASRWRRIKVKANTMKASALPDHINFTRQAYRLAAGIALRLADGGGLFFHYWLEFDLAYIDDCRCRAMGMIVFIMASGLTCRSSA